MDSRNRPVVYLLPVDGAGAHTSRCHLHDKASIYEAEVAPRLG
jgi:peptide/nickel transport system ATP-binding protein